MRNIVIISGFVFFFFVGYLSHQPKTIIKEIKKEVKVYDFSQDEKMMEIYANTMGKTLRDKTDVWEEGFQAGYKQGAVICK